MVTGFEIDLEFCLGLEDLVEKTKLIKKMKKSKPKRSDSVTKLRDSLESSLNSTSRSNFRVTASE